jgi:hypothetical protein
VFDWESRGEVRSAADQLPYVCLYDATGVIDWAVDDRGRLLEVRLLEEAFELRARLTKLRGSAVRDAVSRFIQHGASLGMGR